MTLRYDHGWHMPFPDKGEFFWARADGKGKGPMPAIPTIGQSPLSYRQLDMINEVATGAFSVAVETPYLQVSPEDKEVYKGASGFGDIVIKPKSLLLDCELIQFATEFNVYTPVGNFLKGLGTGHVSLEPAGLVSIKVTPETYLQGELAYRIPIGGDAAFQGPVLHYAASLNQTLWRCGHDIQLLGTAELDGWEFLGGALTAPGSVPQGVAFHGAGDVFSIGPGCRIVMCNKIDLGVAGKFALTNGSIADQLLQVDFRWRF
jgi:hypothetical protein